MKSRLRDEMTADWRRLEDDQRWLPMRESPSISLPGGKQARHSWGRRRGEARGSGPRHASGRSREGGGLLSFGTAAGSSFFFVFHFLRVKTDSLQRFLQAFQGERHQNRCRKTWRVQRCRSHFDPGLVQETSRISRICQTSDDC